MSPTSCRVGSGGEVVGPLGGGLLGVVLFPSPLTPPFRGAAFFPHPLGGAAFSDLPLSVVQFSQVLLFGGVPSPAPFWVVLPLFLLGGKNKDSEASNTSTPRRMNKR